MSNQSERNTGLAFGLTNTIVAAAMADGSLHRAEIDEVKSIMNQVLHNRVSDEDLSQMLDVAKEGLKHYSLSYVLERQREHFGDDEARILVAAALQVVTADGEVKDDERTIFHEIMEGLGKDADWLMNTLRSLVQ